MHKEFYTEFWNLESITSGTGDSAKKEYRRNRRRYMGQETETYNGIDMRIRQSTTYPRVYT